MADSEFSTRALIQGLDKASADIKARVLARMDRAATSHVAYLHAKYPNKSGRLRKGVTKRRATTFGFIVRSSAPHVHFLEKGTAERRDPTRRNAPRGRVKPNPLFVRNAVRERKSLLSDAQAILDQPRELV
jgi:hypothetical protein